MTNETLNKTKLLDEKSNTSIWSKFGSLAFGSLYGANKVHELDNSPNGLKEKNSYKISKSLLNDSIEITKKRSLIRLNKDNEEEFEIFGKIKIYKPGNYVIIFYSQINENNEVKTLNKLYEISKNDLYKSFPYVVDLNQNFFKEGQRHLYQKFGSEAKGYAIDFSKVGVARIFGNEFDTVEENFPTSSPEISITLNPSLIQ